MIPTVLAAAMDYFKNRLGTVMVSKVNHLRVYERSTEEQVHNRSDQDVCF